MGWLANVFMTLVFSPGVAAGAFAVEGGTTRSACDASPGVPGEDVSLTLMVGGVMRKHVLHLPTHYDCATPLPLVVGLHGYYGTGQGFENDTAEMFDHLNANNYIGVFPTGEESSPGSGVTSFNDLGSHFDEGPDGPTCTADPYPYGDFTNCSGSESDRQCHWGTSCANDTGYLKALVTRIQSGYKVDDSRIFMMGFSQGGQSVSGLACELDDIIAAVVPVHGFAANGYTCGPDSKVSLFQIYGSRDNTLRGDGEPGSDGMIYDAAAEAAQEWAIVQGCDAQATARPTESDGKKDWQCTEHKNCSTGAEIMTCGWSGEHVWPSTPRHGNFGLDEVWNFLKRQSK
jgi:polyhydroxybutyrate depolymerase